LAASRKTAAAGNRVRPKSRCPFKVKTKESNIEEAANVSDSAKADIVFIAVHPPVVQSICEQIRGQIGQNTIVISLAPKFTIQKLNGLLKGIDKIVRVIPNAPSIIGAGFNPVAFSDSLTSEEKNEVKKLFEPLGEFPEVEEEKLEAYAVLTAMGPTYFWFQFQALREVATGFGLKDEEINIALKRVVCGSARTLIDSGLSPEEVMNLVPVKPLAEIEPNVIEMYKTRLPGTYQKIKP
jgi:pyrroline-5-carboxylate reductase